jgi:hypothetical protein
MEEAARQCVSSMMKAWRIVVWDVKARGIATMLHVMLYQVQTYVLPCALFKCQLWGPDIVAKGEAYKSQSQHVFLRLYRYILEVRRMWYRLICLMRLEMNHYNTTGLMHV